MLGFALPCLICDVRGSSGSGRWPCLLRVCASCEASGFRLIILEIRPVGGELQRFRGLAIRTPAGDLVQVDLGPHKIRHERELLA